LYAKKVDTAKCKKKWGSIPPKDKLKIKEALPIYLQSTPSMKYRKNPLTWLNGNCWLDVTENNFYINGSGTPKKESSKW
jgi:hypothetical protein